MINSEQQSNASVAFAANQVLRMLQAQQNSLGLANYQGGLSCVSNQSAILTPDPSLHRVGTVQLANNLQPVVPQQQQLSTDYLVRQLQQGALGAPAAQIYSADSLNSLNQQFQAQPVTLPNQTASGQQVSSIAQNSGYAVELLTALSRQLQTELGRTNARPVQPLPALLSTPCSVPFNSSALGTSGLQPNLVDLTRATASSVEINSINQLSTKESAVASQKCSPRQHVNSALGLSASKPQSIAQARQQKAVAKKPLLVNSPVCLPERLLFESSKQSKTRVHGKRPSAESSESESTFSSAESARKSAPRRPGSTVKSFSSRQHEGAQRQQYQQNGASLGRRPHATRQGQHSDQVKAGQQQMHLEMIENTRKRMRVASIYQNNECMTSQARFIPTIPLQSIHDKQL